MTTEREYEEDNFAAKEIRIEECVTDIVERQWEALTSDNDEILDMIDNLAGELGLGMGDYADPVKYAQLINMVVKATWMGLLSKIGEELCQLQLRDIEGEYA